MSVALMSTPASISTRHDKLRVMVVDDSVVIRGMISRWIGAEPDMEATPSWRRGLAAPNRPKLLAPDAAVPDIKMPALDATPAPPQWRAKRRAPTVIGPPPPPRRNAEISFKALSLGASDYIPK